MISIINGPNLNTLGKREPEIYGTKTLVDIYEECKMISRDVEFFQSNSESDIITFIQAVKSNGIIINTGALTHTSIAIYDALCCYKSIIGGTIVELHISNIYAREEFRRKSYISPIADVIICGFGTDGYKIATQYLMNKLSL